MILAAIWITHFGEASPPEREDYKMVQSLRVTYSDGLEVEFGLTVGVAPLWWLWHEVDTAGKVLRVAR